MTSPVFHHYWLRKDIENAQALGVRYFVHEVDTPHAKVYHVFDINRDRFVCTCHDQADASNVCSALNLMEQHTREAQS